MMENSRDDILDNMLRAMLSSVAFHDNVIRFIAPGGIQYQKNLPILLSKLMDDDKLKCKQKYARYCFIPELDDSSGGELNIVFRELKEENQYSFEKLKEKLYKKLDDIRANAKMIRFELYYLLNVKTDIKVNLIKLRDINIRIVNYELIRELPIQGSDLSVFTKQLRECSYIHIDLRARNMGYARQIADKYVKLLLGIIAFVIHPREKIVLFGIPKELTRLISDIKFIFVDEKFLLSNDSSEFEEVYLLTEEDVKKVNELNSRIENCSENIREVIYQAINSYYLGLSQREISNSYLNMWTALEVLCLKEQGVPHIEVIKRLKSILASITPLDKYKIDYLYSIRNNLVHNSMSSITQYDRNLLKSYLDCMIGFFIYKLSHYTRSEIDVIFGLLQKSPKELENIKELANFVDKLRN